MNYKGVLTVVLVLAVLTALAVWVVPASTNKVWVDPPSTPEPEKSEPEPNQNELADPTKKPCPVNREKWRVEQVIDDINISESVRCEPDNPWAVAAFVKGTNNLSMKALMQTRLASDAVLKEDDLDGDGDPDRIHIRLEVSELNGSSPDGDKFLPTYDIAPGIQPGLWVFSPKTRGMAAVDLFSYEAIRDLRAPSPVIRVEQGDQVRITLENTHYLPHTIHLHGVDHPYLNAEGEGNDGVPITDEHPVLPGDSKTYTLSPRQPGTMFYHCHVQTDKHLMMGLQGMFVVEENRPDNWVQTFNVGAGFVRHSSVAVREKYDQEYDLHYQSIDKELNRIIQEANDPRLVAQRMNREYDITDATADYFLLNGRSFPYTLRESLIAISPGENVKLRIVNGQAKVLSLHTHGHKATLTHEDGVARSQSQQTLRDVYTLSSAQRVDLRLSGLDDGLHSYGPGVWLFHNHAEKGITTDGLGPGGDISMIVYRSFLQADGSPKLQGVDIERFFDPDFYAGKIPMWQESKLPQSLGQAGSVAPTNWRVGVFGVLLGLIAGLVLQSSLRWLRRNAKDD